MIRRLVRLVPVCWLALLAAGCAPGQKDIEKSIREEMKSSMNVEITSFDLKKQADGTYVGTATASNGDVYDITTSPPKGGKTAWQAVPNHATVEKDTRAFLEEKSKARVTALQLTKDSSGNYSGNAQLDNGVKYRVTVKAEGQNLMYNAVPVAD